MREIKFRAWDKDLKKFWHDVEHEYDSLGREDDEINTNVSSFADYLDSKARYVVQQFTGLKDKNGKEIYEGDIVRYPSGRVGAKRKDVEIGVIEYKPEGCMYWITDLNGDPNCFTGTENLYSGNTVIAEVIGNIYENPELLNA